MSGARKNGVSIFGDKLEKYPEFSDFTLHNYLKFKLNKNSISCGRDTVLEKNEKENQQEKLSEVLTNFLLSFPHYKIITAFYKIRSRAFVVKSWNFFVRFCF